MSCDSTVLNVIIYVISFAETYDCLCACVKKLFSHFVVCDLLIVIHTTKYDSIYKGNRLKNKRNVLLYNVRRRVRFDAYPRFTASIM